MCLQQNLNKTLEDLDEEKSSKHELQKLLQKHKSGKDALDLKNADLVRRHEEQRDARKLPPCPPARPMCCTPYRTTDADHVAKLQAAIEAETRDKSELKLTHAQGQRTPPPARFLR